MTFRPAIQTVYDKEDEVVKELPFIHEMMLRWKCTQIGNTMLTRLNFLLRLEPVIEASNITPKYLRPSLFREVKMLTHVGVDVRKVWPAMMDAQKCEQITSTINLVSCLRRSGIHHEGLEAAFASWVRKNK
ncbi:hypothetical protein pEaSNUABM6_00207 [Erwinia phage pEa_SNUABM_6]|nr:hypothetical protein pEaSNUABM6_00207 [Erwinia phage pEa_SNUABM_6]